MVKGGKGWGGKRRAQAEEKRSERWCPQHRAESPRFRSPGEVSWASGGAFHCSCAGRCWRSGCTQPSTGVLDFLQKDQAGAQLPRNRRDLGNKGEVDAAGERTGSGTSCLWEARDWALGLGGLHPGPAFPDAGLYRPMYLG